MCASTPGIRSASQRPCADGTILSWTPCQRSAGTRMSPSSKPHGRVKARSSSRQPAMPGASARSMFGFACAARSPVSTSRSTGGRSVESTSRISSAASPRAAPPRHGSRNGSSTLGPASAAPNSSTFCSPMPASQSMPSASHGVGRRDRRDGDAAVGQERAERERVRRAARAADATRSGRHRARRARRAMSFAMSATARPGFGVEPP